LEGIENDFPHPTSNLTPSSSLQGLMRSKKYFSEFDPQSDSRSELKPRISAIIAGFLFFARHHINNGKKNTHAFLVIKGIMISKTLF
jgi:hypothetical protein